VALLRFLSLEVEVEAMQLQRFPTRYPQRLIQEVSMKNFGKLALLGAALAVSATSAFATPITGTIYVDGADSFNASSITVASAAVIQNSPFAPTGAFALAAPTPLAGTSVTLASFGGSLPQLFLTGDDGLTFTLESYSILTQTNTFWNIIGTGYFNLTGYDQTLYDFSFTTTNSAGNGSTVQFEANAIPPTPEPNSLILLGTGLVGAAGMLMRRRRLTA
jgi:hypothetical protein